MAFPFPRRELENDLKENERAAKYGDKYCFTARAVSDGEANRV